MTTALAIDQIHQNVRTPEQQIFSQASVVMQQQTLELHHKTVNIDDRATLSQKRIMVQPAPRAETL